MQGENRGVHSAGSARAKVLGQECVSGQAMQVHMDHDQDESFLCV